MTEDTGEVKVGLPESLEFRRLSRESQARQLIEAKKGHLLLGAALLTVPSVMIALGFIPIHEKSQWALIVLFTLFLALGIHGLIRGLFGNSGVFIAFTPILIVVLKPTFEFLRWGTATLPSGLLFLGMAGCISLLLCSIAALAFALWSWRNTPTT